MKQKIKIAYLIDSLKRAGAQKLLLDICKSIDKDRFEVTIIALKSGNFYEEFKSIDNINIIILKNKVEQINSFFTSKIPIFLKQQKELKKLIKKNKYHIIHSHLFFPDIHNSLIKRKFKWIKTITTKHDTGFYRKLRYKIIGNLFDVNMDYVTTCSNSVTNILKKYNFIKRVKTIHNAIDLSIISKNKVNEEKFINRNYFNIISVGRLTEQKGFDHLIKSFQIFNRLSEKSRLYICGEGEKKKELEMLIKKLGLEKKVFLLGERTDIYSLMKQMDLFILLSNWEGFGLVFLEAMACGLPVIGSDVDGIREIIKNKENGYLINRVESREIVKLISKIKENKELRNKFILEGFKTVKERFNINKVIKEYEDLYLNLIRGKNA